jgi:hypothetical protein
MVINKDYRDSFEAQHGPIILKDGIKYLIEGVTLVKNSNNEDVSEHNSRVWMVKARDFTSGEYDIESKVIEFEQKDDEPLQIVGYLDMEVLDSSDDFKLE